MSRAALLFGLLLCALGCGGSVAPPASGGGPSWARGGDRADADGSHFVCEGQGATEEQAVDTAQGICADKVCRLCGVEVESTVQTTETLEGVSMERKVIERCRQYRSEPLEIVHKSTDCGPEGCVAWLSVSLSRDEEKAQCAVFASEHFADPNECERLIQAFRTAEGRDSRSLAARAQLLEQAIPACANIDVRPTPLVEALHQKLFLGMDQFEFTPEKQRERAATPFFDGKWYASHEEMMQRRGATDYYLTTVPSLRREISETKTLVGRIQLVRDYVHNRSLIFRVIEATRAADLDSPEGMKRLLAALEAAPPGVQYESGDVHFFPIYVLRDVRADTGAIDDFYRKSYAPETQDWRNGIPLATLFAKDARVDEAEWSYIFALHRAHACPVCLITLLEVKDHGPQKLRDQRFFAALELAKAKSRNDDERRRAAAELITRDAEFVMHILPKLPAELQAGLDWDFFIRQVREANDADELDQARRLLPLLVGALASEAQPAVSKRYCLSLGDRLGTLAKLGAALAPLAEPICACLAGPLSGEGTRVLANKSDLYDFALASSLPCVSP